MGFPKPNPLRNRVILNEMYLYCMVEVIGHVFVCIGYRLSLFLRFFYWILELFVFVFLHFISYYVHLICTVKWYISIIKCSVLYYTVGLRKRKKYLIEYDSISQRVRLGKSHLYFNDKTLTNRNELIKLEHAATIRRVWR
jgi:hypothetical protein